MLGLDIAYMNAKFDHFSFSPSGYMVGAHQNLNGSRDLTTPLSGTVCYPRLACYDQTTYRRIVTVAFCAVYKYSYLLSHLLTYLNMRSLSIPTTKIRKATQISQNGVVWGSYGSLKVTGNSVI